MAKKKEEPKMPLALMTTAAADFVLAINRMNDKERIDRVMNNPVVFEYDPTVCPDSDKPHAYKGEIRENENVVKWR